MNANNFPNRGTKRSRPPNNTGENSNSIQREYNDKVQHIQNDDIDVPLSKRINRLNIDYSSSNSNEQHPKESFNEKYPYEADSMYYKSNEMLYSLHEERTLRNQQAALRNALTSHLKL